MRSHKTRFKLTCSRRSVDEIHIRQGKRSALYGKVPDREPRCQGTRIDILPVTSLLCKHLQAKKLATRMKTSRAQLDRLLDPENESVTLGTLARAAQAVGRHLRMELV